MQFKRKIWNQNSPIAYQDFNRIEQAIEDLYKKQDSSNNQDIDYSQIEELMDDKILLHDAYGMSHFRQLTDKADYRQIQRLDKMLEDQRKQINELKKEIEELKEKYEQK